MAIGEIEGWLALKLVSGKCSRSFIDDLANHMQRRTLHIHMILDEIGALEGAPGAKPSITKEPEPFRHKPLKGLLHKHFMQPSYIGKNLDNHWTPKRLRKLVLQPQDNWANDLVLGGYRDRSSRRVLTGGWIVFANHDSANYYLTLGRHGDDQQIWDRCRACVQEFGELDLLQDRIRNNRVVR
jgi:hypothetical protein